MSLESGVQQYTNSCHDQMCTCFWPYSRYTKTTQVFSGKCLRIRFFTFWRCFCLHLSIKLMAGLDKCTGIHFQDQDKAVIESDRIIIILYYNMCKYCFIYGSFPAVMRNMTITNSLILYLNMSHKHIFQEPSSEILFISLK